MHQDMPTHLCPRGTVYESDLNAYVRSYMRMDEREREGETQICIPRIFELKTLHPLEMNAFTGSHANLVRTPGFREEFRTFANDIRNRARKENM